MGKLAQNVAKYLVKAKLEASGVVEKPDVIGAVFGQTEGLLGNDLDLRELQRTGRIGRIEAEIQSKDGKSTGTITIPSSLDASETALIGASLETIERIGPCDSEIQVVEIQDLRDKKRDYVMDRAKQLLGSLSDETSLESQEVSENLKEAVRVKAIDKYKGLDCGPDVEESDEIIIVEGRADVLILLKNGIKNAIAVGGTSVPDPLADLSRTKNSVAFLDGDRGGDLILKELQQRSDLDFVCRAPQGKEVEELTKKEIFKALREKVPAKNASYISESKGKTKSKSKNGRKKSKNGRRKKKRSSRKRKVRVPKEQKEQLLESISDMIGTKAASLYDKDLEILGKVPLKELKNSLRQVDDVFAVVIDGTVDKEIVRTAERYEVPVVAGEKKTRVKSGEVMIYDQKDLE